MGKTEYQFYGLDQIEREFGKIIEQRYPTEFKKMVLEIAYKVQEEAKNRTPHDIQNFFDGWEVGGIKKAGNEYVVEVYNSVEYDEFKESTHILELSLAKINEELPARLQKWINNFIARNNL